MYVVAATCAHLAMGDRKIFIMDFGEYRILAFGDGSGNGDDSVL